MGSSTGGAARITTVSPMPAPPEMPLYVTVERAAKLAGVSRDTMAAWATRAVDPIPHIDAGRSKKLIRVAAIPEYAMSREAG